MRVNTKKKNPLMSAQKILSAGDKFVCNKCCKKLTIASNFYKSNTNPLCVYPIIPTCKKCLLEQYEKYKFEYGEKLGLKIILRKIDKPYLDTIVANAMERQSRDALGYCIKTLNGLSQYSTMTYDDSDFIKNKILEVKDDGELRSIIDEQFTAEDWDRWSGYGLEPLEIILCKNFYQKVVENHEIQSLNEEMSVEQLAVVNISLKKAFKEGDSQAIERLRRTISSIEGDLNIQGKQKKDDLAKSNFGNFIKMIENEEPIPEPIDEFKDVDGIWSLIRKYIIGYLPVAMGKAREDEVLEEDKDILDE